MAKVKKFNLKGEQVGTVEVADSLQDATANSQLVKDYIIALRANARQWSANTKGRSEVNHSTKKPHAQKGGGRARQGSLVAPQYKGGGIVFGPKPKFDQHVRINKKERIAASRTLISEKIKAGNVCVLNKNGLKEPKTKTMAHFFENLKGGPRVLVLGESKQEMGNPHENLVKSLRNIPKKEYSWLPQLNGYALARCHTLVVLDTALDEFLSMLGAS